MLINIEVHSVNGACFHNRASVKEYAPVIEGDLLVFSGQTLASLYTALKPFCHRAFRVCDCWWSNNHDSWHLHARFNRRMTNGSNDGTDTLSGLLCIELVHGLKIIGAQHQDEEIQRRVCFDALRQANVGRMPSADGYWE
jgi:hypothetical protein